MNRTFVAVTAIILLFTSQALAQKKVALVIGNSAYKNTQALLNPENDANDTAAAFRRLGFATTLGTNLDKAGMEDLLIRFSREIKTADVASIYYAGHGLQFGGVNYLVPVDAKLEDEVDLRRLVRVDEILSDLQGAKTVRILILDACRDNPLADEFRRKIDRSRASFVQSGLAKLDSPVGTIIAYATQAGRTAEDGTGRNSPFTRAIVARLADPTEIGVTFRKIASDVYEQSSRRQLPELSISLVGEYYLAPGAPAKGPVVAPSAQSASTRRPESAGPRPVTPFKKGRSAAPLTPAEAAAISPGETFQECPHCPELVVLPAGEFMMGASADDKNPPKSELPFHSVRIADRIAVGRFEVTNQQFAVFLSSVAKVAAVETFLALKSAELESRLMLRISSGGIRYIVETGYEDYPVSYVTFQGAVAYVEWLKKSTGLPYRLLSEAEWEYAARATTKTEYFYGTEADWKLHCDYANISDLDARQKYPNRNAALCNDGFPDLAPVGRLKPNSFGLYDVYGNVMEWVADCWHQNYEEAPTDGSVWTRGADCNGRVVRGGSIDYLFVGSSTRMYASYDQNKLNLGIRVARTLP
jgi:formylglycine-generating enzyme required for sulfatase activity